MSSTSVFTIGPFVPCIAPPLQNPKYASDVNMPNQTKSRNVGWKTSTFFIQRLQTFFIFVTFFTFFNVFLFFFWNVFTSMIFWSWRSNLIGTVLASQIFASYTTDTGNSSSCISTLYNTILSSTFLIWKIWSSSGTLFIHPPDFSVKINLFSSVCQRKARSDRFNAARKKYEKYGVKGLG